MTVSAQQQATWVRNFNPFVGDNRFPTVNGVYEPLMIYNTIKGELVPWLATGYEWGDGNRKLTFKLRDDVQWSDGQPFTARDVVFTFNLFKEHTGLQGPGGQAMTGETAYIESVTAPDDTTVEFTFAQAFTPGLYDIANQNIVPEHIWKDVADPLKFTNENPVGTGPFTEVAVFQNQVYEVHRNPNYWQPGKPAVQGLRFPAYPGNDQANLATINGENDWAGNFIPDIEQTFVAKDPEHFGYWFPSTGATVMLYLNTTRAPFDNVDVRKAISMALNRDQIVEVAMYGYTHPADATGLSDAYPNYKSERVVQAGSELVTRNIERANQLLDAAGLTRGAGGIRQLPDGTPLRYDLNVVSGWTDWVSACQIMAQNLREVGIEATVRTYDFSAWFERVQKGDFDMSIGWSSGGATPFNYYRSQMSQRSFRPVGEAAGENWHRYVSQRADELLNQFAATSDLAEQQQIAEQLQQTFVDELPAVPLFPGPMWYEYNTRRFEGFPNEENPYAVGSPFGMGTPEQLILMTTVKPK
ncbi:ABC transporter substrate-binding protein [Kallotenue papyrolyticum]|uniref:ABC transporter substrate-binding protein n=1 Tax=Kallotenue papyrolyticum TaxID=1325125 RepID=UPI0004717CC1|nr:ABC transporter substrate-binding protein [Kallotenue papyrolyticum]